MSVRRGRENRTAIFAKFSGSSKRPYRASENFSFFSFRFWGTMGHEVFEMRCRGYSRTEDFDLGTALAVLDEEADWRRSGII
jgi:hypothetical protein